MIAVALRTLKESFYAVKFLCGYRNDNKHIPPLKHKLLKLILELGYTVTERTHSLRIRA
jgi:hypothetical protein